MALLGSNLTSEVGLRLLLCPLGSNVVVRTACCSIGIALPVYSTFRAIERNDQFEQQKWLVYWAAYGSFSLVEVFSDKLLSWCPLYYHIKFAFLVWLQLPTVYGARQLYVTYLRPFFLKHQAKLDQIMDVSYVEMAKQMSAHEAEIHFVKAAFVKVMATMEQILRGKPVHPQQPPAIEGQRRLRFVDPDSDPDD